jgi:gas vesicle protein
MKTLIRKFLGLSSRNKLILGLSILFLIIIIRSFPQKTFTEKSLAYGDDLNDAIEKFEEDRKDFTSDLNDITKQTSEDLLSKQQPVEDVAINWENEWNELNQKLEELENDFLKVGKRSKEYFKNLDEIASGIRDKSIRIEENEKNRELKAQWTRVYQEASESINKIRDVIYDGNDFYKVLVATSIRQQVKEDIKELESITLRAVALLDDLEDFSTEGKKLINKQ